MANRGPYYLGPFSNIVGINFGSRDECTNPESLVHFETLSGSDLDYARSIDGGAMGLRCATNLPTPLNAGLISPGKFGNAIDLADSYNHIETFSNSTVTKIQASSPSFLIGFDPFTWDCWIQPYLHNHNATHSSPSDYPEPFLWFIIGGVNRALFIKLSDNSNLANPFGRQDTTIEVGSCVAFPDTLYLGHTDDPSYPPSRPDINIGISSVGSGNYSTGSGNLQFLGGAGSFGDDNYDINDEVITVLFTSATDFVVTGTTIGAMGSGNTSIDFTSNNAPNGYPFLHIKSAGWSGAWAANDKMTFTYASNSVVAWQIPLNKFTHFAITRDENDVLRIFLDGQMVDEIENFTCYLYGTGSNNYHWIQGAHFYVDEARMCINTNPLWVADFTPPTSPYVPA